MDYTRPKNIEYTGASVAFTVPEDIGKRLDSIAERTGVSKFHIMFSAYCILLNKYSECIDINVGIPEFGRNNKDIDKMIGMFVNTLVIRTQPQNEKRVLSYMKEVSDTMMDAIKNNEYPYDLLVKKLGINIDGGRNPLFDTMFAYQNIETDILALNGVKAEHYNMVDNASIFDIVMYIYVGEFIEGKVTYSSKLYKNETIEQLIKDYFYVIEQIDENDNITISEVMTLKKKELADELKKNVFEFAF